MQGYCWLELLFPGSDRRAEAPRVHFSTHSSMHCKSTRLYGLQNRRRSLPVQVGPGPRLRFIVGGLNGFLNRSIGAMFSRPRLAGLLTPRKT